MNVMWQKMECIYSGLYEWPIIQLMNSENGTKLTVWINQNILLHHPKNMQMWPLQWMVIYGDVQNIHFIYIFISSCINEQEQYNIILNEMNSEIRVHGTDLEY